MGTRIRQALCCECGNLRTCVRPRNHQRENYWLHDPVDPNWHRELGDLKCEQCGQITRHAILHPDNNDSFRDHAERITRMALGGNDPCNAHAGDHIRQAYRQGRQPNPYMNHVWSTADEEAARKAGKTTVMTYCGESAKLPAKSNSLPSGQLRPEPVRWEQEYEDPDTGNWWVELDCPDCLRAANERRVAAGRKRLKMWLIWLVRDPARVPDEHIETLIAALETATQGGASE